MAEGSPARTLVAAALLLSLAAIAVWGVAQWRSTSASPAAPPSLASVPGDTPPSSEPSPPPAAEPAPSPAPAAEPTPDPTANGPATGPYAAFSPSHQLTHPDTDPDIRFWYDTFGYYRGDETQVPSGVWANKAELWDQLAPAIREEAVSLPEVGEPQFLGMRVVPAVANVRWSSEDTLGRGELVEFTTVYQTQEEVIERYSAALIVTDGESRGAIQARMSPFELVSSDFANFNQLRDEAANRQWRWIMEQPLEEHD